MVYRDRVYVCVCICIRTYIQKQTQTPTHTDTHTDRQTERERERERERYLPRRQLAIKQLKTVPKGTAPFVITAIIEGGHCREGKKKMRL